MCSTDSRPAPGARDVAWRDSETAAQSIGLTRHIDGGVRISALFAGLAGAIFAPLMMFVARLVPLLAVDPVSARGHCRRRWLRAGSLIGAAVTVMLPELLSHLAEYRLLFVGLLLLVVLWIAPEGIIGTLARYVRRINPTVANADEPACPPFSRQTSSGTILWFRASAFRSRHQGASDVSFVAILDASSADRAERRRQTTVLNMIGGFYRPEAGSIRLGTAELAGAPAWRAARAGVARTTRRPSCLPR